MTEAFIGPDDAPRCAWAGAAPEFLAYHDGEWGFPSSAIAGRSRSSAWRASSQD